MTFQQIITSFGFLLSLVFLYYNSGRRPGSIFLGLFFLFLSAYSFSQCVLFHSSSAFLVSLAFIHSAILGFLIGPALYFFIRSVVQEQKLLKKSDIVHLIPAILFIIAASQYYFTPWHDKMEMAGRIILNRGDIVRINSQYISWLLPGHINLASRPLLVLLYALVSLFLLVKHAKTQPAQKIIQKSRLSLNWLTSLLVFTLLLALNQTLMAVLSISHVSIALYFSTNLMQILSGTALFGILVVPFFYPSVLYGIASLETPPAVAEKMAQNPAFPELDESYLSYMETVAVACMEKEKPYLSKDFNLTDFARLIDVPAHHLSYYFREVKKQTFNDFRNEWRVKHAKALIDDIQILGYTIEAIGLMSGFSSKNTFFVSFKKFEGMTPGAYAKLKNKD
jgi:AraC-like DNA-binding protein